MYAWQEWIGPSPCRTLIAMECKAVWESRAAGLRGGTDPGPVVHQQPAWPSVDDSQHFYVYPVPDLKAAVIWIGGRSFLVGTPPRVGGILLKQGALPDNVILLSWASEHTE